MTTPAVYTCQHHIFYNSVDSNIKSRRYISSFWTVTLACLRVVSGR